MRPGTGDARALGRAELGIGLDDMRRRALMASARKRRIHESIRDATLREIEQLEQHTARLREFAARKREDGCFQ
jgi:hypothetical protein